MQERLKALADLQKVDLEILALRKSAEVYPRQMGELERELSQAKGEDEAERGNLTRLMKVKDMIAELRGKRMLEGFRGKEKVDTEALIKAVVKATSRAGYCDRNQRRLACESWRADCPA